MRTIARRLSASAFLRHNAIFFFGAVAVGALNYLYYPVLGRMLSIESFGEVQTLVSLFVQLQIFLTVMSQVTVNVVANYEDEDRKLRVVYELEKVALFFSFLLFFLTLCLSWKLRTFFHFDSAWPFVVLMLAVVAAVPMTFRSAYLRGHKMFGSVSVANLLGAAGKIALSALLVLLGMKTLGAMFGVVLSQILGFGYAAWVAYKIGFRRPDGVTARSLPDVTVLRPEVKYGLLVLVGSLTVTVLSSVDTFIVKHYFDAQTAGRYAGVSTVARMIYFLTASIAQVLLPSVKVHQSAKQNQSLLMKSLGLVAVLGGGTYLIFLFFSNKIVSVLMGHSFTTYAHLLGRLSLAMLVLSVLNILVSYYIALRRYQLGVVVLLGAAFAGVLLAMHHQTLEAVVNSLLYGSIGMLALFGGWFAISKVNIAKFKVR